MARDEDAERSVLAAMLLGDEPIARARSLLPAEDFYCTAHQRIFAAILTLNDCSEKADLITVTDELRRRGDLEVAGGREAVAQILECATTTANVEAHCKIIREAARKRQLRRFALDVQTRAGDPTASAAAIIADLEAKARELGGASNGAGRFADAALDAAAFGGLELPTPPPLLVYGGHSLLCAGDGALMFGKAGIGKTALALGLTVAIALGEPWFGIATPVGGVAVGLLELELPEDALQERLRVAAGDRLGALRNLDIVCRPALKGLVDLDTERDRSALRSWVKGRGLRLIAIDALVRAHGGGEDDEGLQPLLLWLDTLGRETACAFLLIHHERKGDPKNNRDQDPLDAARGHSMLTTYPMLCMRVFRHGPVRALAFPKATRAPEPELIHFRLGDRGRPESCEAPAVSSKARGESNRARILTALRAACTGATGIPAEELEASTGLSRSTVRAHLASLLAAGEVVPQRHGRAVTYRPNIRASEQGHSDTTNSLPL